MKKKLLFLVAILAAVGLLVGGYFILREKPTDQPKTVTVEIVADGKFDEFTAEITTTKKYVYDLLIYLNASHNIQMTVEESAFGNYITGFFGYTAEEAAHEFFAFYVNGEPSVAGINQKALADGETYRFVLETW